MSNLIINISAQKYALYMCENGLRSAIEVIPGWRGFSQLGPGSQGAAL